jgi:hypothetical protein
VGSERGRERGRQNRSGAVLLVTATGLLVAADAVAAGSAQRVRSSSGCSTTTHFSAVAPVVLATGGFVAVMALVTWLATAGVGPRVRRRPKALFVSLWVGVVLAYAGSALAMAVTSSFKLCV